MKQVLALIALMASPAAWLVLPPFLVQRELAELPRHADIPFHEMYGVLVIAWAALIAATLVFTVIPFVLFRELGTPPPPLHERCVVTKFTEAGQLAQCRRPRGHGTGAMYCRKHARAERELAE